MTYPAAAPRKSGGALKWILLGCGTFIFLGIGFFAIAGYLVYRSVNTDPAHVETSAKEILTFEKPEGFNGIFSMSMMGLKMAMFMRNTHDENAGTIMIASYPGGKDTEAQFRAQIDQNMKQQGRSREVSEKRPAETFKVRGKDVTSEVDVISSKDDAVKTLQYTLMIEGAAGKMVMIVVSGPEKTTDHVWVQKFLDTIK